MRVIIVSILIVHALIHLLGFIKSFSIYEVKELTQHVSKTQGVIWLCAFLLISLSVTLYISKFEYWWIIGIISIFISQLIIFQFWKEAKYGSLPNLLFAIFCLLAWASFNHTREVKVEVSNLLEGTYKHQISEFNEDALDELPIPVRNWLRNSGAISTKYIRNVYLKQTANIKLKPDQNKWSETFAEQYINSIAPGYLWSAKMNMIPLVPIIGRDKYIAGMAFMNFRILSIFPVSKAHPTPKSNQSALQRYLAEIVWHPTTALHPLITWESIDEHSARATLTYKGVTGSGIFIFDEDGRFKKFKAMRYLTNDMASELKEWVIEVLETKEMNGVNVPTEVSVTWKLEDKDWTWLKIKITDIEYNVNSSIHTKC